MKIIKNNGPYSYSKHTLKRVSKKLNRIHRGYEDLHILKIQSPRNQYICEGYISALYDNKLINTCERNWLRKIYVECISTDDGLGERYNINKNGEIEDYNEDTI